MGRMLLKGCVVAFVLQGCSSAEPDHRDGVVSTGGSSLGSGGAAGNGSSPTPGSGGASPTSGGGSGGAGTGGTPVSPGSGEPKLPTVTASCPTFTNAATVQIPRKNSANGAMPVVIYIDPSAKSKPDPGGPLVLYYHATGGQPSEVHQGFGDQNIAAVTSKGGVVASFTTTPCPSCTTTDDFVWWVEDADVQDTVVACAIQQAKIDTRRIHALGWSAGALHADWVALARSNYMASVISYSGGYPVWPGTDTPQDPTNHIASIMTYGDSSDVVLVSFPTQSKLWYSTLQPKGYYTMMCNHAGGHEIDPGVAPVSLQFFLDHPYKVSPDPYGAMIPSAFPSYCKNMP
jgi:predicted esterase